MLFYKFIYLKIFLYPSENWLIKFEINKNQYLITIFSLYIGKIKWYIYNSNERNKNSSFRLRLSYKLNWHSNIPI